MNSEEHTAEYYLEDLDHEEDEEEEEDDEEEDDNESEKQPVESRRDSRAGKRSDSGGVHVQATINIASQSATKGY